MTNKQKTEEFNKDLIKLTNLGVNAGKELTTGKKKYSN